MFGRVLEGMDEVCRLEKVETVPVTDFPIEGVEVNRPVKPEIIERVELELHGEIYPEPVSYTHLDVYKRQSLQDTCSQDKKEPCHTGAVQGEICDPGSVCHYTAGGI